jgi:phage-related protein
MRSTHAPSKVPLVFFRTEAGTEPVRQWLKEVDADDRRTIGEDLLRAQYRWPIGMPLCRPLGKGLWEIRTNLTSNRTARVFIGFYGGCLVALHGFVKKTRATRAADLALARKRQKELEK